MNKTSILIVEDDKAVRNLMTTTMQANGYAYHTAETGESAILQAVSAKPDVILLDLGLPDIDGVEIIKKVRSWTNNPIIVVSARSEDRDKIDALDDEMFSAWLKYHFSTCERKDLIGYSNHVLYIGRKK